MNPAWTEAVRQAAVAVLRNCGVGESRVGPAASVADPIRVAAATGVAIDLLGPRPGSLALFFPERYAADLAAAAFPLDCPPGEGTEAVGECLAELANLIAGHAAGALASQGLCVDLAPPRALPGPHPEVRLPLGAEAVLVPVASNRGTFLVAFSLCAPADSPGQEAVPVRGLTLPKETPMSKVRALVVDDSRVARSVVVRAFQQHGCEVVGLAENGEQAIEMFQKLKPDLVTLDLVMPQLDGVQALKQIKQIDPKAVVIVVSSVNKKETVVECIRSGAANFLLKPFDPARVGEVLAQCFPGRFGTESPVSQ